MKKSNILLIILLILIVFEMFFFNKLITPSGTSSEKETSIEENATKESMKDFEGDDFAFNYDKKVLSAIASESSVTITHSIPHEHSDPCDFQNGAVIPDLTDFYVSLEVSNKDLSGSVQDFEPDNIKDLFVDGEFQLQDNFIEKYAVGDLNGYQITQGVEGCGTRTYYFPLNESKTLRVERKIITELSNAVSNTQEFMSLHGVIRPQDEGRLFKEILKSFALK